MASTHGYVESTRHGKEKNSHGHKQTEGLRVFNSIEDYQWHTGCFRKYLRKHTSIVRLLAIAFYLRFQNFVANTWNFMNLI